jgi:hypothetical protein
VRHCGLQKVLAGVAFRTMPLKRIDGVTTVWCVNDCIPPSVKELLERSGPGAAASGIPSTMHKSVTWNAMTLVDPPTETRGIMFNPGSGAPVRMWVCTVCGYVELYAAVITDPKAFGFGNG